MEIRLDDLSSPATQALVRLHLAQMYANSPPGHALAVGALATFRKLSQQLIKGGDDFIARFRPVFRVR